MLCIKKKNKIKRRVTLIAFVNWSSQQVSCSNRSCSPSRWARAHTQTFACSSYKSDSHLQASICGTDGWGSTELPHHWNNCKDFSVVKQEEGWGELLHTSRYFPSPATAIKWAPTYTCVYMLPSPCLHLLEHRFFWTRCSRYSQHFQVPNDTNPNTCGSKGKSSGKFEGRHIWLQCVTEGHFSKEQFPWTVLFHWNHLQCCSLVALDQPSLWVLLLTIKLSRSCLSPYVSGAC